MKKGKVRSVWKKAFWGCCAGAILLLLPGLVPWLAAAFWFFYERTDLPVALYEEQESAFCLCLVVLAVLGSLPLLGRGYRRWIPAVWCMAALCWGMIGLRAYHMAWSPVSQRLIPYSTTLGSIYVPLGQASWAMPVAAAVTRARTVQSRAPLSTTVTRASVTPRRSRVSSTVALI